MFKFFAGVNSIPDYYSDQLICDSLSITKTQLDEQPYDWVVKMMNYLKIKADYEKFKAEKEKNKQKANKPHMPSARIRKR